MFLKFISFSLNCLIIFLAYCSIEIMFCFKNKIILESTFSRKEILVKPCFTKGKEKALQFKDFNYFTRKQELSHLAHFYTTGGQYQTLKEKGGNSLVIQWLGLCIFTAKSAGSIMGQGAKILQAVLHCQKN